MKREAFIFGLILVALLVVGCTQMPVTSNNISSSPNRTSLSTNFSREPFTECVTCVDGKTWDNKSCCAPNFEENCSTINGVVRWQDLHPLFSGVLKGCFQKALDAGKACGSGSDCISGICHLDNAAGVCTLLKKEVTGKSQFGNKEFFTATYSCPTERSGVCAETIDNLANPDGVSHYFKMNGSTMIEVQEAGPIY
jgi:hypothetical protein